MKVRNWLLFLCFCCLALSCYSQESQNDVQYIESKIAEHYRSNKDSANYYCLQLARLAKQQNNLQMHIEAYLNQNRVLGYHDDYRGRSKSISTLDSLFQRAKTKRDSIADYQFLYQAYLHDKAALQVDIYNYKRAEREFRNLIDIILAKDSLSSQTSDIWTIHSCNNYLAFIKVKQNKKREAIKIYEEDIAFLQGHKPVNQYILNETYRLYGSALSKQGNFEKSNQLLKQSLNYFKTTTNVNSVNTLLRMLSSNYIAVNELDSARHHLRLLKDNLKEQDAIWNYYHSLQAEIFNKEDKPQHAIEQLTMAAKKSKVFWGDFTHPELADNYLAMGDIYASQQKAEKANAFYQKAIAVTSEFQTEHSLVEQAIVFQSKLKQQNILVRQAGAEHTTQSLRLAGELMPVFDQIKSDFSVDEDRFNLLNESFTFFENSITSAYRLFEQTNNEHYIDTAFYFIEKSKANVLRNAIQQSIAMNSAGLPDSLTFQEKQLQAEIKLIEGKEKVISQEDTERLIELKNKHVQLIKSLENNYSDYYKLKYNNEVVDVAELQSYLAEGETVISTFFGGQSIYIAAISKHDKQLIQIPNTAQVKQEITTYYQLIKDQYSSIENVRKVGNALFARFILPIDSYQNSKHLIVLPDGVLNYIPVESFSTSRSKLHYLIYDKAVSYAPSASLFLQLKQKKSKGKLLSFAPDFSKQPNAFNLMPINQNIKESELVKKYFHGKQLLQQEASKDHFLQLAGQYGLIHLSTHARYNDSIPDESFLAFTPVNDDVSPLLYANEIYDLDLSNVQLVTLSACETGIGELTKGDGLLSLSRAFFYAGVPSITTTLWQINDLSTVQLMDAYYNQLSKSEQKSTALQMAKVDFLDNNQGNEFVHPYYWAAFVVHGNDEAIVQSSPHRWLWYGAIAMVIVVLVFMIRRKRNP